MLTGNETFSRYRFAAMTRDYRGARTLELGLSHQANGASRFVPFSALSGGEALVFASALMIGLLRALRPKLSLLMLDGAELLSPPSTILDFLQALKSAGDGVGNMIVTCNRGSIEAEGWETISLGSRAVLGS